MNARDAMQAAPGSRRIAVIGAGVVGTSIALALRKRGADVTLLDRDEPGHGCSYGNSGAISPGSVAPVAMPGVAGSVPGMLLDPESPLFLRLGYLPQALPWLLRFLASSRAATVEASAAKLAALHAGAVEAHEAMTRELGVPELLLKRGHLHLYPDDKALAKDAGGWRLRQAYGVKVERLDRGGIEALEPNVPPHYRVGMYLADHATILNPFRYVQAMARACAAAGGRIVRTEVKGLQRRGTLWVVQASGEADGASFDDVVVAAGAWSRDLLAPLGIRLALETQRGYHAQFEGGSGVISRTVVLADHKIFLAPMEDGLRAGGTVEIAGLAAPPDERRAATLARIVREGFPGLRDLPAHTWMGHRPCMPDSVPVIGPALGHPSLWLATGHGHLGLTDSLNTARRVADGLLGHATAEAHAGATLASA
jgi:D-amino-acid dehydrogenase